MPEGIFVDALPSSLQVGDAWFRIFDLSPDAIDLTRLEDALSLDCNPSYLKLYGYTREAFLGHHTLPGDLGVWVRAEDRARHVVDLKAHGQIFGFEAPFRRADGSIFIGQISSSLLEVNGALCNLSFTRDITERLRAQDELCESAQRLELALAAGNLGIWDRLIAEGRTLWDDRMFAIYGLDRAHYKPDFETWLREIVHPEDAEAVREGVRAAEAGHRPYDLAFRIVRPGGEIRHIKSHGIVVRDDAGAPVRVIGINQDRTEQAESEAERQRLQQELHHAEKLESIGSLAGGVAHDMNNVLAAILVTAELLQERFAPGDAIAKSLDVILHAGRRGRDLVKALTDFARKGLDHPSEVDLNEVLRKEVELLRHTTLQKIAVRLELDEQLPPIQGVASDLGSAVMNLSVNALDAMPEGGVLTFRTQVVADKYVELTISDTGLGMPPEILSRAMEPFFTTKPAGKGTGLGLSRVYGTVRAHGGTVEIQSEPRQGTTVRLRFPAGPGAHTGRATQLPTAPDTTARSLRILLVDDESIILDAVPALLASLGHTVETVARGDAALRRLMAAPAFDLVILDHNMPGLTGLETLVRLREIQPKLPVILSTGYMDPESEALLHQFPAAWMLKKPYGLGEIRALLARISPSLTPVPAPDDPAAAERLP